MNPNAQPKSWKHRIARVAGFLVGVVFLLAALSKIGDLAGFQKALAGYPYLPFWLQSVAVIIMPGLELAIGFSLTVRLLFREGAIIAGTCLLSFLSLEFYNDFNGYAPHQCGCFKISGWTWLEMNAWAVSGRNLALLALSFFVILSPRKEQRHSTIDQAHE